MTVGASAQTINPRPGSPVCFGRRTNHGAVHHPLRWKTSHDSTVASATTESPIQPALRRQPNHRDYQPALRRRLTVSGATHRFASANERVTGMTVGASAQTINPRPGSPVCFGRRTSHGAVHHPLRRKTSHDSAVASATTESPIQPTLRRQPNHRDGQPALRRRLTVSGATHQSASAAKRVIGSADAHFGARLAVPGGAHHPLRW
jgi:hypothetical protein